MKQTRQQWWWTLDDFEGSRKYELDNYSSDERYVRIRWSNLGPVVGVAFFGEDDRVSGAWMNEPPPDPSEVLAPEEMDELLRRFLARCDDSPEMVWARGMVEDYAAKARGSSGVEGSKLSLAKARPGRWSLDKGVG